GSSHRPWIDERKTTSPASLVEPSATTAGTPRWTGTCALGRRRRTGFLFGQRAGERGVTHGLCQLGIAQRADEVNGVHHPWMCGGPPPARRPHLHAIAPRVFGQAQGVALRAQPVHA